MLFVCYGFRRADRRKEDGIYAYGIIKGALSLYNY